MRNKRTLGWFLFGLGGQLQLVASLSFTELFVLIAAPLLFSKEIVYMKRTGVSSFFNISLALLAGCVVACLANHTQLTYVLRGMAVCCLIPCSIVVVHWMFRCDMAGLRWSFVGGALSSILSTFIFQKSVEVSILSGGVVGAHTASAIMGGATYWTHRIGALVMVPAKGWYLGCPTVYCVAAPLFLSAFSMLTTASGRGSSVRALAAAVLVIIGGKRICTLRNRICHKFWLLIIVGILGSFLVKTSYQVAVTTGLLGEKALKKYESQTKGDTSMIALLLGGRMESFCGLLACVDKPIIGFGPWARDKNGYREEFVRKYGTQEDYDAYIQSVLYLRSTGREVLSLIPCHSVVTELWLWYGINGLIFCLYVFYVMLRYLKQDCWAIPQWFFWIGAAIPGMFWDMCFNPLSNRIGIPMFVVGCLIARAVRRGVVQLPREMLQEIAVSERK